MEPTFNISLAEETVYPFLKITREDYPRLLATRKIAADGAEYFGAFLPSTGVRFWLEFLNRVFRLRTCQIPIDGSFPAPCTQFYVKRCVAPCVASLCDRESYLERVELVRLFLRGEREMIADLVQAKIDQASENLDFEWAAAWRDILYSVSEVFGEKSLQLWLDDAVDTYEIDETEDRVFVSLVTQRGRKTLGKKVFVFENRREQKTVQILSDTLWQFYQFHSPREIRVPFDFPSRKLLEKALSRREDRPIRISVIKSPDERKTSRRALKRARFDFDLRQVKPAVPPAEISAELKEIFGLKRPPQKIEAFDAAHISGRDFTAAKSVWREGKFIAEENRFWLSGATNEPETLRRAVSDSFGSKENPAPDLLLIDGGSGQLRTVLKSLPEAEKRDFRVIAAVKPPGRHAEISHFITETGTKVRFLPESEAMRVLTRLRDDAHNLANEIHRQRRENTHFYELASLLPSINEAERRLLLQGFGTVKNLAGAELLELSRLLGVKKGLLAYGDLKSFGMRQPGVVKPLIVPIRYDDPNGDAADLRPLVYRSKKRK